MPRNDFPEIYKFETSKEEEILEKCGLSKNEATNSDMPAVYYTWIIRILTKLDNFTEKRHKFFDKISRKSKLHN